MIEINNISKYYGTFKALDSVSFSIKENEVVALLGPNGSGKTTLLRILTGFLPASSGTGKISGFDIFEDNDEIKKIIGYLPEAPPLYNDMTVYAYLKFVASIKGVNRKDIKKRVTEICEKCGISKEKYSIISHLSKGYRQRVGIAQALIHKPKVVILDEPTSGLDPNQIIEIRNFILSIKKDTTILIATHILSEASLISDKVVIINNGNILAVDNKANLSKKLNSENQFLLVTKKNDFEKSVNAFSDNKFIRVKKINEKDNIVRSFIFCDDKKIQKNDILKILINNDVTIDEFKKYEMELEDIFVEYTNEKSN